MSFNFDFRRLGFLFLGVGSFDLTAFFGYFLLDVTVNGLRFRFRLGP
jgi:hypothetical protein